MNIKEISIQGLFHLYNYDIPFSGDSLVSVITGPNGYGKTTILTMLSRLAGGQLYYFYMLPFGRIRLSLSDGSEIVIIQDQVKLDEVVHGDKRVTQELEVRFSWRAEGRETCSFLLNPKIIREAYRRVMYRMSSDQRSSSDIQSRTFARQVMSSVPFYDNIARTIGQEQFLLRLNSLSVVFVPANRIYKDEDAGERSMTPLEQASQELKDTLKKAQLEYYYASQQSDSELMDTLLRSEVKFGEAEYKERALKITEFAGRLAEFGFMGKPRIQPYSEKDARILSTYIVEMERKLSVYRPIMEKLTLFSDLLKSKSFADKSIMVSPNFGIRARTSANDVIDLDVLSSGEKNEIMLLYRFIFTVPDNAILLLDEPENSLHVVWQRMLIEDILKIAPIKNLQVIIATHSSRIVTRAKRYTSDLYYINKQHV